MIDVDAVELRVGYINVKDNVSQAMLVPVWVFKTTTSYIRSDGKARGKNRGSYIFNAIDGGYIKESLD